MLNLENIFLQNKPHTAILKFKEALECNFRQLGPLYNIAVQYRKLAKFDAETATLKMLVDVSISSDNLQYSLK